MAEAGSDQLTEEARVESPSDSTGAVEGIVERAARLLREAVEAFDHTDPARDLIMERRADLAAVTNIDDDTYDSLFMEATALLNPKPQRGRAVKPTTTSGKRGERYRPY